MSAELRKIDNELKLTKKLVDKTFMLTVDTRYKGGFERVESSYETFLNGAKNLKVTLENISAFIFELETEANHCFNLDLGRRQHGLHSEENSKVFSFRVPLLICTTTRK